MKSTKTTRSSSYVCSVQTMLEEFENTFFLSAIRPSVHTNPDQKQSFSKMLFKPEEFENAGFSISCGRKNFEISAFRKRWDKNFFRVMSTLPKTLLSFCFTNANRNQNSKKQSRHISRHKWKQRSEKCLDQFSIFLNHNDNFWWRYYYFCHTRTTKDQVAGTQSNTHRTLLWVTAWKAEKWYVGKILRSFLMVVTGYPFSLLRMTTSYLLIVIPDGIIINDESHEEKWRHYSIKDDFPGSNLKERIHVLIRWQFKATANKRNFYVRKPSAYTAISTKTHNNKPWVSSAWCCVVMVAASFAPWRVRPRIDSSRDQTLKIYLSLTEKKIQQNYTKHVSFSFFNPLKETGELGSLGWGHGGELGEGELDGGELAMGGSVGSRLATSLPHEFQGGIVKRAKRSARLNKQDEELFWKSLWTESIWRVFRVKPAFTNSTEKCVDGAW